MVCSVTYSSHGVDAIDVIIRPAGRQLVGVLLLLCTDTNMDRLTHLELTFISELKSFSSYV